LARAGIEHPELDVDEEAARLDALATRSGAAASRGPQAALDQLVAFLFFQEGFRGNDKEYYDPRNSCLNDVLDRRLGIPITLAVVVMEVGRRVGLDILGIGLPGHFCVGARLGSELVLLDPFASGRALDRAEAEAIASRAVGRSVKLTAAHFAATSRTQIVVRMLR